MEDLTVPFCSISLQPSFCTPWTQLGFSCHTSSLLKRVVLQKMFFVWACNMLLSFELPVCILTVTESSLRNKRNFCGPTFQNKMFAISEMYNNPPTSVQDLSFIISLCTASLFHRNPGSTRMSCDSCCAHGNDKKYTLELPSVKNSASIWRRSLVLKILMRM